MLNSGAGLLYLEPDESLSGCIKPRTKNAIATAKNRNIIMYATTGLLIKILFSAILFLI